MTRTSARLLAGILLGLAVSASPARPRDGSEVLGGLDALVERGLRDWQVPGLAVAVVRDGAVVLAKGYGVRSLKTRDAVTPDTLFYIASATKSFTATLAAMMVEDGKADWDRPLHEMVPAFRMFDPFATERATLKDLLSHRTGVPRQEFLKSHAPERRTDLAARLRHFEPAIDFRSGFLYCNETVTVAGDLLAAAAGTTWEDLVRRRIFEPLGMTRSAATVAAMKAAGDHAWPYIVADKEPEEMAFYDVSELRGPAGAVISSVHDLSRWLLFNISGGQADGKPLLDPKALAQLWVPQVPATRAAPRHPELSHQSYALGWFVDAYRGSLRVSHPGNLYGFTSMVSFLPREKLGVAVLANLNGTPLAQIVERFVYDALLGLPPVDWNARTQDDFARLRARDPRTGGPDPGRRPDTRTARAPEAYAGTYVSPGYGTLVVRKDGDGLAVALHSGAYPLRHRNYDVFEFDVPVEGETWFVKFRGDSAGDVVSLAIDGGPGSKEIEFARRPLR